MRVTLPTNLPRALLVLALLAATACNHPEWQAQLTEVADADKLKATPYVRCHLRDGGLVVLERWQVDKKHSEVAGFGTHYNAQRAGIAVGHLHVAFADIALLETNRVDEVISAPLVVLGVVGGLSTVITLACLTNPKACFGSCPTFYLDGDASPVAEGFSASISKSLEATDLDALWTADPPPGPFALTMRNEALETHLTDRVRLLALPHLPGERVLQTPAGFVAVRGLQAPLACQAANGDCLPQLLAFDGDEWSSRTDGHDLASRETLTLQLPHPQGSSGLLLATRNTLLNTFLFYQVLAWMADDAGDWLMRLDDGDPRPKRALDSFSGEFAALRVQVLTERGWQDVGSASEIGPIAREVQLLQLPDDVADGPLQVRLNGTRGYWKIDQVALATVTRAVTPVALDVQQVTRDGVPDPEALALLRTADGERLRTLPGDALRLAFVLPPGPSELFLESRGYYIEWLRQEWLSERNPLKLLQLVASPAPMLRALAPTYGQLEPGMEAVFWQSRMRPKR